MPPWLSAAMALTTHETMSPSPRGGMSTNCTIAVSRTKGNACLFSWNRLILTRFTPCMAECLLLCVLYGGEPGQCDGVWLAVSDGEVPHTQRWWQDGTLQRTAACHCLVSVQRRAGLLAEDLRDHGLDGRKTRAATHDLHSVNVLLLQAWNSKYNGTLL